MSDACPLCERDPCVCEEEEEDDDLDLDFDDLDDEECPECGEDLEDCLCDGEEDTDHDDDYDFDDGF